MLEITNVSISYKNKEVVSNVSFSVDKGEIVAIVGESGSGKSTLIRSIMGLLGSYGRVTSGKIIFNGRDMVTCHEKEMHKIRGKEAAMIFQHAELSLDPLWTIADSFYESVSAHNKITKSEAMSLAIERLSALSFDNPKEILKRYPHQLSGGMCQRAAIAISMANNPKLLLADEPTSALDVTIQAQVIDTMMHINEQMGTTILIVTHNMGIVEKMADKVGVVYNGRLVEWGPKDRILYHPCHEYTQRLIDTIPTMDGTLPIAGGGI